MEELYDHSNIDGRLRMHGSPRLATSNARFFAHRILFWYGLLHTVVVNDKRQPKQSSVEPALQW